MDSLKRRIMDEFCQKHAGCEGCIIDKMYSNHDCGGYGLYTTKRPSGEYEIDSNEVEYCYNILRDSGYEFAVLPEDNSMSNNVDHPSHYNAGKIEAIDFIEDQQLNFSRGSALKYLVRAGKKDPEKEIEDLEKAVWYIEREIERVRKEKNEESN